MGTRPSLLGRWAAPAVDATAGSALAPEGARRGRPLRKTVLALAVVGAPFALGGPVLAPVEMVPGRGGASIRPASPRLAVPQPARAPVPHPPVPASAFLGVLTGPGAARIRGVVPGSPADVAGLREGDVICAVEGVPVGSATSLRQALARHSPGERVTVLVTRGSRRVSVPLTLKQLPARAPAP